MKNLGIVLTLANLRSLHAAPGKPTLFHRQRNNNRTHFKLVDTKRLFHDLLRRLAICKCVMCRKSSARSKVARHENDILSLLPQCTLGMHLLSQATSGQNHGKAH